MNPDDKLVCQPTWTECPLCKNDIRNMPPHCQLRRDALARGLHREQYGHLERRYCTKDAPMTEADMGKYMWGHPDAVRKGTLLNVIVCDCPHCGLTFTCFPP